MTKTDLKVIWSTETNCFRLDPLPSKEELKSFYEKDFYSIEKPDYVKEEEEDREWHELAYGDRVDQIKALMPEPTRVVEIGCGTGRFLKYLTAHFNLEWAVGIEPDSRLAAQARELGLNVSNLPWELIDFDPDHADVIFAHFVLEHLLEPVKFLRWAHDLLSKNGILYLAVPNDFTDIQAKAAVKIGKPNYWLHKTHLNYWGFDSLEALLRREGFEPVARDTTWQMETFLLSGRDYTSDPELGRKLHRVRVEHELATSTAERRIVMQDLALLGIGRDAIIYSRKV